MHGYYKREGGCEGTNIIMRGKVRRCRGVVKGVMVDYRELYNIPSQRGSTFLYKRINAPCRTSSKRPVPLQQ